MVVLWTLFTRYCYAKGLDKHNLVFAYRCRKSLEGLAPRLAPVVGQGWNVWSGRLCGVDDSGLDFGPGPRLFGKCES